MDDGLASGQPGPGGAESTALREEVQALRQRVAVLETVNVELTRELDLAVLLQLITEKVAMLLRAEMAGLSLWNARAERLEVQALYGPLTWLRTVHMRLGEGLTGRAAQERRGVRTDDYQHCPYAIQALQPHFGAVSLVAEPVLYQGRLLGVITAGRQKPAAPFIQADQDLLAIFASQAAVAIENARLFQELQHRESRYRALVEGTIQGLSIFDTQGQRVFANTALARMLGYERPEDILGQHVLDGIAPEDQERLRQYSAQRLQGQAVPSHYAYRRMKRDGTVVWIEQTITPTIWDTQLAYLVTSADITRRVQLEEQVQQYLTQLETLVEARAQRIQELERQRLSMEKLAATAQITAGIAHEINNPLAGIKNAFFLLKETLLADPTSAVYVELIEREIVRMITIVRQMYELHNPAVVAAHPCSLAQVLEDVCRRLAELSATHQVSLRCQGVEGLPSLAVVESYLLQILSNLVRNAIQASPPQTEVLITGAYDGTQLTVAVRDHGPGITPEHRRRLFEPFFTTRHGSTQGGMGLGLSIAHTLATAMGGQIEVQSTLGQGSAFTLMLPCAEAGA